MDSDRTPPRRRTAPDGGQEVSLRRRRPTGRFRHRRQRTRRRTEQGRCQRHGKGKTRADQTMGTVQTRVIVPMVRRSIALPIVLPGAGSVANLVQRRQGDERSRRHRASGHQHQGQGSEQSQYGSPLPGKVPLSDAPHAYNSRDSASLRPKGLYRAIRQVHARVGIAAVLNPTETESR
jgi:hypothetical protein